MISANSSNHQSWRQYVSGLPWQARDVLYFALVWLSVQYLVIKALVVAGGWWSAPAKFIQAAYSGDVLSVFGLAVLQAAIEVVILWWWLRRYRAGIGALGWRPVPLWRTLKTVVVVLIGFIVLASTAIWLVSQLVPAFDPNQTQSNQFAQAQSSQDWAFAIVAMVVLPPVLEESIFRGLAFAGLAKRWGDVAGAVVSSGLFALAHGQANVGVYTFVLGLLLCWLYRRFHSIAPGVLVHMANNAMAFWAMSHLGG